MGIMVNAVKEVGSHGKVCGAGADGLYGQAIAKFDCNAAANLEAGLKACPVVRECRDIQEGMAQGDLQKAAANAGVLALAVVLAGGASHVGFKQANILCSASAQQTLQAAALSAAG